jgi:chemotaxis protein CheD
MMIGYTLNIGDVITSSEKATYACFGLGSCVGLFIQDRLTGLSGGAHIFLPANESGPDTTKFYSAEAAVDELLKQFRLRGSNLTALRAKLTGGANVISVSADTGARNSDSVISYLKANRIFIAGLDIGGVHCRTAKFQSDTGLLTVKSAGTNALKIY